LCDGIPGAEDVVRFRDRQGRRPVPALRGATPAAPALTPSGVAVNREHHRWHSPSLGREMELLVLGHAGARMLVFPTSMGRFFEWEDRGMADALGDWIHGGQLQLVCVDSVDAESWYAKGAHPHDRARRQSAYEGYLLGEVLPFSEHRNGNPFVIAAGASFGAYHALNTALRHPHRFGRAIGMSGLYDIREQADGYYDEAIHAHNPSHYVSGIDDRDHLEALRRMDIVLATGAEDAFVENNRYLSRILWERGVGNALRIWDGWAHDWPWWRQMIRAYAGGHD
jgi:esterase/lipase superfamily enzyme